MSRAVEECLQDTKCLSEWERYRVVILKTSVACSIRGFVRSHSQ